MCSFIHTILLGLIFLGKAAAAASLTLVPGQSLPLRILPDPITERQPAIYNWILTGTPSQDFWVETKVYRAPGGVPVMGLVGWDESMASAPHWDPLQAMLKKAATKLNQQGLSARITAKLPAGKPVLQVDLKRLEVFYGKAVIEVAVGHVDAGGRRLARVVRSAWIPVPENWRLFSRESFELKRLIRSTGADLILEALAVMNLAG